MRKIVTAVYQFMCSCIRCDDVKLPDLEEWGHRKENTPIKVPEIEETLDVATEIEEMDKQIQKVQKDIKKASKDTEVLEKMDKKFDKKVDKAEKVLKRKRKSKYE